ILAHATLALGLIVLAFLPEVRVDLMGYLFGDILAVSWTDCLIILVVTVLVLGVLASIWRALLTATVSEEIAAAEGLDPARARVIFMVLLAAVIAAAMKIVGILLITALLIIPAAAARRFARGPEAMAVISAVCGVLAVVGGLALSWVADTPAGPSVVAAALLLFLASLVKRGD
ncbi:MAG: iron chelate uptake ABC transporter family permease subunit, partial [Pseudomonadota bacterium]|nr:iron chelate uptake ABC transporter family permease subunit [Pseudomonadota bacterium]